MFLVIPVSVVLLGLMLAGLAFGFSYLLFKLFGRTSGLDKLGEFYPAVDPPDGEMYRKQWIAVGPVYYKNTADLCIGPRGLYLWVRPFLGEYKPVMIPWAEFREPRRALLCWHKAVRLTIGDPEITTVVFTQRLCEKTKPYLGVAGI